MVETKAMDREDVDIKDLHIQRSMDYYEIQDTKSIPKKKIHLLKDALHQSKEKA